jgi:predicted metal-binding protein
MEIEPCLYSVCPGKVRVYKVTTETEVRERRQAIDVQKHLPGCPVASIEHWSKKKLKEPSESEEADS